jgi:chromosome segregation ATPase
LTDLADDIRSGPEPGVELALRAAEVETRELAVAAAERVLAEREREVEQAVESYLSQSRRVEEVREEYEKRRRVLAERARELAHERRELRAAQAELVGARADLEERAHELDAREAALVAREAERVEPTPARPASPVDQPERADAAKGPPQGGWSGGALGHPLEAA